MSCHSQQAHGAAGWRTRGEACAWPQLRNRSCARREPCARGRQARAHRWAAVQRTREGWRGSPPGGAHVTDCEYSTAPWRQPSRRAVRAGCGDSGASGLRAGARAASPPPGASRCRSTRWNRRPSQ
eukprot:scaffold35770_cov101-Isochrysis_galbana.AAC.2